MYFSTLCFCVRFVLCSYKKQKEIKASATLKDQRSNKPKDSTPVPISLFHFQPFPSSFYLLFFSFSLAFFFTLSFYLLSLVFPNSLCHVEKELMAHLLSLSLFLKPFFCFVLYLFYHLIRFQSIYSSHIYIF